MTTWNTLTARFALIAVLSCAALTWAMAPQRTQSSAQDVGLETAVAGADSSVYVGGGPAKKPATHKVEKKPFKIEIAVKGVLEPEEATPIVYRAI